MEPEAQHGETYGRPRARASFNHGLSTSRPKSDRAEVGTIWPARPTLGRGQRGEQVLARALAAPALLGTQTAVLVLLGVALALRGAVPARDQAGLELAVLDRRVGAGLAGEDARGRHARVGAVEAEAQAALHVADVVLGERCVGADRAVPGALAALVDAPGEDARVGDERPRVGLEDGFDAHVREASSTARAPSRAGIHAARRPGRAGSRSRAAAARVRAARTAAVRVARS